MTILDVVVKLPSHGNHALLASAYKCHTGMYIALYHEADEEPYAYTTVSECGACWIEFEGGRPEGIAVGDLVTVWQKKENTWQIKASQ